MQRWCWLGALALAVGLLGGARPAAAQTTIYSNLGPGDTYIIAPDGAIAGPSAGNYIFANAFTVGSSSAYLQQVRLALQHYAGSNTAVKVHILADEGGRPGALQETATLASAPTTSALAAANFSGTTVLNANSTYWLAGEATGDAVVLWFRNKQAKKGWAMSRSDLSPAAWSVRADESQWAFEVQGSAVPAPAAVPEPGAVLLFLPALGVVVFLRRQRSV